MINERIQKYIDDHTLCSEYLFKDWEAFLDLLYAEDGRISFILWWDYCRKDMNHISCGSGGYTDPDDREWIDWDQEHYQDLAARIIPYQDGTLSGE